MLRVADNPDNHVIDPEADSAARVVYDHFGGAERFPDISAEMMAAVDKADSAAFSVDEVLDPKGWILMSFLMDPRTGLGRFRELRISNYDLMMQLIDDCLRMSVHEILLTPDVRERVDLYRLHAARAEEQIRRCAVVHENLVVLDLRSAEHLHSRALGPQAAEHSVRRGQVDPRPLEQDRRGNSHARVWRRRTRSRRHLSDREHRRPAGTGGADQADHDRRLRASSRFGRNAAGSVLRRAIRRRTIT